MFYTASLTPLPGDDLFQLKTRVYQGEASQTIPFWDFLYNRYRQDMEESGTLIDDTVREVFDNAGSRLFGATLLRKEGDSGGGTPPS